MLQYCIVSDFFVLRKQAIVSQEVLATMRAITLEDFFSYVDNFCTLLKCDRPNVSGFNVLRKFDSGEVL